MDKKGFLLAEETLKIILAVIAIGFLAYLLFSIYSTNKDSANLELAKASINLLNKTINEDKSTVEIYNPRNWIIYSWPNSYSDGFLFLKNEKIGMPNFCSNLDWNGCICICKKENPNSCDENGICIENLKGLSFDNNIKIENPPVMLSIDHNNKKILRIK
ncbi:hypothetical protein FJZ20_00180 [Candidatus Pacearchaeota archaeon]|nr:hypothetical protein [Candidatus Pacearchaeota archaeon]